MPWLSASLKTTDHRVSLEEGPWKLCPVGTTCRSFLVVGVDHGDRGELLKRTCGTFAIQGSRRQADFACATEMYIVAVIRLSLCLHCWSSTHAALVFPAVPALDKMKPAGREGFLACYFSQHH